MTDGIALFVQEQPPPLRVEAVAQTSLAAIALDPPVEPITPAASVPPPAAAKWLTGPVSSSKGIIWRERRDRARRRGEK